MVYEYSCTICNIEFERFHKIMVDESKDFTKCPECNKKPKRLISRTRIVFKDKSTDTAPWEGKEVKWFGSHGDLGNAEKVRLNEERVKVDEENEKSFYNHKDDSPSAEPKRKTRKEVKEGRALIKEMSKR